MLAICSVVVVVVVVAFSTLPTTASVLEQSLPLRAQRFRRFKISPCDWLASEGPRSKLTQHRFRDSATSAAHQIILMLSDILSFLFSCLN